MRRIGASALLNGMGIFEAVARVKSFKFAAEELRLTASAISHSIRNLEERIQVRLFNRERNVISMTPEGETLYRAISMPISQIYSAIHEIEQNSTNSVTIRCNTTLAGHWLIPLLGIYRATDPDVDFHVLTFDDVHGGSRDTADITINYEKVNETTKNAGVLLLTDHSAPVIAPSLVEDGDNLADINDGKWSAISCTDDNWDWEMWSNKNSVDFGALIWRDYFSIDDTAIEAAVGGMGMILQPRFMIEKELVRGDLVFVPDAKPVHIGEYRMITTESPKKIVRTISNWLLEQVPSEILPNPHDPPT